MEIEVIDPNGNLSVPLSLIYILLRYGHAKLKGRYVIVTQEYAHLLADLKLRPDDAVPEVRFCPSDEPKAVDVNDVFKDFCVKVYKYFGDRCAACVIKVYSVVEDMWLVDEEKLVRIFDIAKDHQLPLEWSTGSIILTTCPENYDEAYRKLRPGDYVKGLEKLKKALAELTKYYHNKY